MELSNEAAETSVPLEIDSQAVCVCDTEGVRQQANMTMTKAGTTWFVSPPGYENTCYAVIMM